ncbi:hypothetical protein TNCV_693311 [Trichonephila clavipes]|nr:hypothetical protein TNCV_693311 [Trichonephila clavipes]
MPPSGYWKLESPMSKERKIPGMSCTSLRQTSFRSDRLLDGLMHGTKWNRRKGMKTSQASSAVCRGKLYFRIR